MKPFFLLFACVWWCAPLAARPPRVEVSAAVEYVSGLPAGSTAGVRLAALPSHRGERDEMAALLSLALNLVSQSNVIARPVPVAGGSLLAFDLGAFGIDAATWEAVTTAGEPYYHLRTQVAGKDGKPQTVFTDGGWVGLEDAAKLRALTGSASALVRADWLLARLITTVDVGAYYEFAGVANQTADQIYTGLGIDFAATDRLGVETWAALLRSDVTHKPRRIIRRQGAAGGAWKTEDTIAEAQDADPIRDPLARKAEGTEHVVAKLNGLPLFLLTDAAGKLVEVAPANLATDHTNAHGDAQLAPALSCITCHREGLLRPFGNDLASLISGGVDVLAGDPARLVKLAAYFRDTERILRRDREDFATAVSAATGGLAVEDVADILPRAYRRYAFEPVTMERAADSLGVTVAALHAALAGSGDPIALALISGHAVQRKQWEGTFAEAALSVSRP